MGTARDPAVDGAETSEPPMESYNRLLMEQIGEQLKRGFGASLQARDYCVVRTGVGGVLSVLASAAVGEQHDVVFGPKPFAACVEYVNASFARAAQRGESP